MPVALTPDGLQVDGKFVPVYAGAVHYWRLEKALWPEILEQVKSLGFDMIETYIPWSVHETEPGPYDWGQEDERKNIEAFMELCEAKGIWLMVRPGPLINAELTHFGFPAWVLLDPAVQARTSVGSLHLDAAFGLHPPHQFPVPSYASEAFYQATGTWFDAVCPIIARHLARVATEAPAIPHQDLHPDEYYHLIYRLIWEDNEGYVCVTPKPDDWNGWRLGNIKTFLNNLPVDSTLAIGVLEQGRLEIGLILQIHEGMIDRVTTFEALELAQDTLQVGSKLLDIIWQQLGQKFAPPAVVLLCTPAVFEAWINGENKRLVLQLAITASTAALAIRKDIDPTDLSGYASPKEA